MGLIVLMVLGLMTAVALAGAAIGALLLSRQARVTHQPEFGQYKPSEAQIRWIKAKHDLGDELDRPYPKE